MDSIGNEIGGGAGKAIVASRACTPVVIVCNSALLVDLASVFVSFSFAAQFIIRWIGSFVRAACDIIF
jgi:hypothetical protein